MEYKLEFSKDVFKDIKKLTFRNLKLKRQITKTLLIVQKNPFYPSLKTHKVNTREHGKVFSSRITGDLRIVWDFDNKDGSVILIMAIGGHAGGNKVYRQLVR